MKRKISAILCISLIVFLGSFMIVPANAEATVEATTMEELVNIANAAQEDTNITLSASFNENLNQAYTMILNTAVTITIDGNNKTLYAALNAKHLIINNSSGSEVIFKNIRFYGDHLNASNPTYGGLELNGGSYQFDKVTVYKNESGIKVGSNVNTMMVTNSSFDGNYRNAGAGAITAEGGLQNLEISNSSFINNSGGAYGYPGGAVWVKGPKQVTISDSYFKNNISYGTTGGGALAFTVAQGANVQINNSYFEKNKADCNIIDSAWSDGGAIYFLAAKNTATNFGVNNNTFVDNYAQDDGGAIMIEAPTGIPNRAFLSPTSVLNNNTFVSNQANGLGPQPPLGPSGGAVQVSLDSVVEFNHNTFYDNNGGGTGTLYNQQGGAIATYTDQGKIPTLHLSNNLLIDNYVSDAAGVRQDSLYSNIYSENIVTNIGNIGVDNGTALDNTITTENVFGTATPQLQMNQTSSVIGNANDVDNTIGYIPTLMILETGLADDTAVVDSKITFDARGYSRTTTPDVGAVETVSVNFDANGGLWQNLPTLTYDGSKYYSDSTTSNYYVINNSSVTTLDATNLTNGHKALLGWSSSSSSSIIEYGIGESITMNENKTLYAIWGDNAIVDNHVISFNTNGGNEINDISVVDGGTVTSPIDPVKEGYNFKGWYLDDQTFTNAYDFTSPVNASFTLHAKWEEKVNGGITPNPTPNPSNTSDTTSKSKPQTVDTTNIIGYVVLITITLVGISVLRKKEVK
ncbi:MAG: InlB B-repeat-containing protein [Coprobacillaceae bacterium]